MKKKNWKDISYLKYGTLKQRQIYQLIMNRKILEILDRYSPILVGTIPIEIDIDSSDLDFLCKVDNFTIFEKTLKDHFEKYKGFKIRYIKENVLVCNFWIDGFEIEIYGSEEEHHKSNGYRHMVVENRLLNLFGKDFKEKIITLKKEGMKTEPAFAKVLHLKGNCYEQLLLLENYSDKELYKLYANTKNLI